MNINIFFYYDSSMKKYLLQGGGGGTAISIFLLSAGTSYYAYYVYKKFLNSSANMQIWNKIPFIKNKMENEKQKMKEKEDEDTKKYYNKIVDNLKENGITTINVKNINTVQTTGYSSETLVKYLHTLKELDPVPKLLSGTIYDEDDNKHKEIMKTAYNLYAYTNPMHADLFHSVVFMEKNLIVMISKLF